MNASPSKGKAVQGQNLQLDQVLQSPRRSHYAIRHCALLPRTGINIDETGLLRVSGQRSLFVPNDQSSVSILPVCEGVSDYLGRVPGSIDSSNSSEDASGPISKGCNDMGLLTVVQRGVFALSWDS